MNEVVDRDGVGAPSVQGCPPVIVWQPVGKILLESHKD